VGDRRVLRHRCGGGRALLARGAHVALSAAARTSCATSPGILRRPRGAALIEPLDFTDAAAVAAAWHRVHAAFRRIDLVADRRRHALGSPRVGADRRRVPCAHGGQPARTDRHGRGDRARPSRPGPRRDRHRRVARRLPRPAQGTGLRRVEGCADQLRRDALPRPAAAQPRRLPDQPGFREDAAHRSQRIPDAAPHQCRGRGGRDHPRPRAAGVRDPLSEGILAAVAFLRHLPYRLYFAAVRRATGL